MAVSSSMWCHPAGDPSQVCLMKVPADLIHSLAQGTADLVGRMSNVVTPYLSGADCAGLWKMRSEQIAAVPADASWVTRFVVVPGVVGAVGLAGFHGQPDERGMVEVGYRIDPLHRRKGYARAALETLLSVARAQSEVRIVRATIGPENSASRALAGEYGFCEVGEQWDDEDGPETIFEVPARPS